jgi:hypothetical protein
MYSLWPALGRWQCKVLFWLLSNDSAGSSLYHAYEVQGEDFTVKLCVISRDAVFVIGKLQLTVLSEFGKYTVDARGREIQ